MNDHDVEKKRQSVGSALSQNHWPKESTLSPPSKRPKTNPTEEQGGSPNLSGMSEAGLASMDTVTSNSVAETVSLAQTALHTAQDPIDLPVAHVEYLEANPKQKTVTDISQIASIFTPKIHAGPETESIPQPSEIVKLSENAPLQDSSIESVALATESSTEVTPAQVDDIVEKISPYSPRQQDAPRPGILDKNPATNTTDQSSNPITNEQLIQALTSSVPDAPTLPQEKKEVSTLRSESISDSVQREQPLRKPDSAESLGMPSPQNILATSATLAKNIIPTTSSASTAPNNLGALELSAALRRLSGAAAQSEDHASPSEILENALAAVVSARPNALENLAANFSQIFHAAQHRASISHDEKSDKTSGSGQPGSSSIGRRKGAMAGSSGNALLNDGTAGQSQAKPTRKPRLIVKNDQVWKAVEGKEEKMLGFYLYKPGLLLPNMEDSINGIIEVRVPARYLNYHNARVKKRALWGTDIYTDDSDVVAMTIHCGKYLPPFQDPEVRPDDPLLLAIAGKQAEAARAARRLAISGRRNRTGESTVPDHDLTVTLRVLPRLCGYASTTRHRLKSREWGGNHDGVSFHVDKVEKIKKGEARPRGRSTLKSDLFAYETYRKRALGLENKALPEESSTVSSEPRETPTRRGGRTKPTPRGLRSQGHS